MSQMITPEGNAENISEYKGTTPKLRLKIDVTGVRENIGISATIINSPAPRAGY